MCLCRAADELLMGEYGSGRYVFTGRCLPGARGRFGALNLALHVNDRHDDVIYNRHLLLHELSLDACCMSCVDQTHGNKILHVTEEIDQQTDSPLGEADALITTVHGQPLAIFTADCLPIALIDRESKAVAAVHAGWKGTALGIAFKTAVEMVRLHGCDPVQMNAVIGPSIGPCCYDFDPNRLAESGYLSNRHTVKKPDGGITLDLRRANVEQLVEAGIPETNIKVVDICTACNNSRYFSHRADGGNTGRQALIVWLA